MSELQIPFEAVQEQINSAVDAIVQLDRGPDGSRRITEVAVVTSQRREPYRLQTIAAFEAEAIGAERIVRGRHVTFPLPAALAGITARVLLLPAQTDLYFRVADNEAELPFLQHGALKVIPGVWGHRAGSPEGIPEAFAFLQQAVREALQSTTDVMP